MTVSMPGRTGPTARVGLMTALLLVAVLTPSRSEPQPQAQRPDAVLFRIIVLESADAARLVRDRIAGGGNFVALAHELSVDASASNGGLVGPVAIEDLREELRTALQGLGVGELSPVVPVAGGFAVLKVVPGRAAEPAVATVTAGARLAPMGSFTSQPGGVKYASDVSGYTDTVLSLRSVEGRLQAAEDLPTFCELRQNLVTTAQALVAEALADERGRAATDPIDRAQAYYLEAQLHSFQGEMDQAIEAFEQAGRIAAAEATEQLPLLSITEALGIAHLHKAEMENGVFHAPGERCLLSGRPGRGFENTPDVVEAIGYFVRYLEEKPDELEVRWLLNVAHMYAGTYPDGVPPAHLIPPEAFASAEDAGRFVDVAEEAGLVSVSRAGGLIVDDFDNDGRLDVVTSSLDSCAPMQFFRRTEAGPFDERASAAGLAGQLGGLNIVQTDYDNDGNLDILVLRGAWETPQRKSLLRNNGDGTFTDVTVASGLATLTSTQAAVWVDTDNDGWLDLFVGSETGPAQLFHNSGDGTFEDVASRAGVDRTGFNKGVTAADYDNDGWPDLYVSNLGGTNFLYRNNGDGTFTELGAGAGAPGPGQGFPTWFFDYDNDGYPDLFVASYVTSVDETARAFLKLPRNGSTLKLYRNLRDGSFEDVTRDVGLDTSLMVMGANFGDIDNAGFLDLYLGTGNPSYGSITGSRLFRNSDGRAFVDVTISSGTGELHKGHGIGFADLDHDGDEEIVFEVGGATPADAHAMRLFENPGHGRDWLSLKLVGVKTNRAAIGARITVTVDGAGGRRSIHRTVTSGGSFGASPLQQHIGLGTGAGNVEVEIWWPTSDTRQRFSQVGPNQYLEITEFAETYRRLERPPLPLGPAN